MIPLGLQDELIVRMEKEFKHLWLKNINNEKVTINIFPQHLPSKSKKEDIDPYPCIIIRLADGNINDVSNDSNDSNNAKVQFIIGIIDRDSNKQGYRDALTVANRICESLLRNPMIDNNYELELPINWVYNEEDSEPYFFVGLETKWSTPGYLREDVDVEGLI